MSDSHQKEDSMSKTGSGKGGSSGKSGGGKGGGAGKGGGGKPNPTPNLPSKTGNPSGPGRSNNPPKK